MLIDDVDAVAAPTTIVYLHGFNSSPDSHKAQTLRRFIQRDGYSCRHLIPALSFSPIETVRQLSVLIESELEESRVVLIGSSLGGYYSLFLAEKYGLRAALINPAVRPYELLDDYLGETVNPYTGERYVVTKDHMGELKTLDVVQVSTPERFFLLTQTSDQTLDYRQAIEKLSASPTWVEGGGSHDFENFSNVIPAILSFLRINKPI